MIKPILIAALLAAPVVNAADCFKLKDIVSKVHEMRYSNISSQDAWELLDADTNSVAARLVHEVYTKPRYATAKMKNEQRVELVSKWFLYCESNNRRLEGEQ